MLDTETRRHIDNARDVLVGKVPDPKAQVEQITIALIYKFMHDMDQESVQIKGKPHFFTGDFEQYNWSRIIDKRLGGQERLNLYSEAIIKMTRNEKLPKLFRDIFSGAFLPYRDPETLNLFLKEINWFKYDHSEQLGNAYEYLLSVLGSQGEAGQFRTPRHIIDFITEIVDPKKNETVLDPACGTAGFLISAYKHILNQNKDKHPGDKLTPLQKKNIMKHFVGYDISPDMVRLSRVNMYLHGFIIPEIFEYDSLTSEEKWQDNYDVILANPPFMTPKGGIRPHNRFSVKANRSEVLFVDYMAEHLNVNGRAGFIIPEGIIFQSSNAYKSLRKMLVDEKYLYAVVSLPAGVFNPYSGVKTSILLLDKNLAKKTEDILFVKIENDGYELGAQRRESKKNDIPLVTEIIKKYQHTVLSGKEFDLNELEKKLAHSVQKKQISESGDYNFTGDRYKEAIVYTNQKWSMVKLGKVADYINGFAFKPSDWGMKGKKIIRIQNLTGSNKDYNYTNRNDIPNKFVVNKGNLLISWSATIGFYIWNDGDAYLNQHIFKVIPKDNISKMYLYFLGNKISELIIQDVHGNTMKHITKGRFNNIKIPLPPLEAQDAIVAELDGYRKIIDGARQVVENYKPSIKINPDWETVELGKVCDLMGGGTPSKSKKEYWTKGTIKWISARHINNDIVESYELISEEAVKSSSTKIASKNAIIFVTRVSVGKIALASDDFAINQDLTALMSKEKNILVNKYLFFVLKQFSKTIESSSQGLGVKGITRRYLTEFKIPLPPIETQQQIVSQIEEEQKLVESNKKLIELFEQKTQQKINEVWGIEEE